MNKFYILDIFDGLLIQNLLHFTSNDGLKGILCLCWDLLIFRKM